MGNTKATNRASANGNIRRVRITMQLTFIIPVVVLALLVLAAIFAPLLAPYPPTKTSLPNRLLPPFFITGGSSAYLLGTDLLGRDVLSRVFFGARFSLSVSLIVILITSSIGTILGITAGYLGGRADTLLMRITDVSHSGDPHSTASGRRPWAVF
jgi:peptide/nickel transport system permease protein